MIVGIHLDQIRILRMIVGMNKDSEICAARRVSIRKP
jgi:hypothetical protein